MGSSKQLVGEASSLAFLDPAKTRADYLGAFLRELRKVRVPWGEGETLIKAMENVSKRSSNFRRSPICRRRRKAGAGY
jgi:hypothetical protein